MKQIELEAGEHILEIDIKAFIINPGRMFLHLFGIYLL